MLILRFRAICVALAIRHEVKWMRYLPSIYWHNRIRADIIDLAERGF